MLKKMRHRFITAAMAAFVSVIIILLCIINIWNYNKITDMQDKTIQTIISLENERKSPEIKPPVPFGDMSDEVQYMMRFFIVKLSQENEIEDIHLNFIASVSENESEEYAEHILKKGWKKGFYKGYRYAVINHPDGKFIVFLNSERELLGMKNLFQVTVIVSVISLAVLFVLVTLFSKRAIAPYVRNIETQKRFITGAGHELKTPLTAISTSADVLEMEFEENEWVNNIRIQVQRMTKLITGLITLSRLDEEQPYPEKSEFSLSDAVWELSEPYSSVASANGKEFIQHIEDEIIIVGDRNSIQQMISILLDNALKYSLPNGKIRLEVRQTQKKTEISVYNTCHIENYKNIGRIFERFYRLDESHSERNSYGIGLSIAKAIVENHHGTITAESQNGDNLLIKVKI